MWSEKTKEGKTKFREQYKNPLTGKYNKVSITFDKNTNATRRKAQIALERKIQDKLQHVQDGNIKKGATLGEVIAEWEPVYKKQVLSSTYYSWATYKKQIKQRIGFDTLVNKITPKFLINIYEDMLYKEDYDKSFVVQLKAKVNHILKYAYQHDYTTSIASAHLEVNWPKRRKDETTEEKFLEDDELEAVINYVKNANSPEANVYATILEWQALTGMRIGETVSLQKKNIYKANDQYLVDVHGTLVYHGLRMKDWHKSPLTKTDSSYRTISLPDRAVTIYKDFSAGKKADDLVFSQKGNRFADLYTLGQLLRRCKKELGIPKILSSHTFRHTNVSKLAELGVPLYIIQNRLGHSDSEITSRIYLHVTKKAKKKYEDIIKKM